jgi:hypothetical protein
MIEENPSGADDALANARASGQPVVLRGRVTHWPAVRAALDECPYRAAESALRV